MALIFTTIGCRPEATASPPKISEGRTPADTESSDDVDGEAHTAEQGSTPVGPRTGPVPHEVELGGHVLTMGVEAGRCTVTVSGDTLPLIPSPPCYFVHRNDGQLRTGAFPDADINVMALVVGTPATAQQRARWNVSEALACGMQTQAILVGAEGVHASKDTIDEMLICPTKGADAKVLWQLAHP